MLFRKKKAKATQSPPMSIDSFLRAVLVTNSAMTLEGRRDGALASIPMRRPAWMVPPVSWLVPFSSHRRVELDATGAFVLGMCDAEHSVEEIIEELAARHKLSFREAQLPVTQFVRMLLERGIVAVIGISEDSHKP